MNRRQVRRQSGAAPAFFYNPEVAFHRRCDGFVKGQNEFSKHCLKTVLKF